MRYFRIIHRELELRKKKNPRYSLRAFARDLGVSLSSLSDVLNGKAGFSSINTKNVADKLCLSNTERDLFIASMESKFARSIALRKRAEERVAKLNRELRFAPLDQIKIEIVSDWWHFAILQALELKRFQGIGRKRIESRIAEYIGISEALATDSLAKMEKIGLVSRNGSTITPVHRFTAAPSNIPSAAVRNGHAQLLDLAKLSLNRCSVEQRDFGAITMTFDEEKMEEAKDLIRNFRREFALRMNNSPNKDHVYTLSMQFFPLTKTVHNLRT